MNRNKRNTDALGIIMVLLIIPLIVYWKELLIIGIIFLVAKIIYKIIKIIATYKSNSTPFQRDGVNIAQEESGNNSKFQYEEYLKNKYVQKGIEAEEKITRILERIYPKDNIIHDSYFRDDELVTTQVDVIAIDITGIYIIESKAYSSIIKGKTDEKTWVQLFSGKKYQKFYNPIIQNNRHVQAIKNNLKEFNVPDNAFKSYIVFDNNCKLEVEYDKNCIANVIQQRELFYTILEDRDMTKQILKQEQVEDIVRRLRAHANVDEKMKMNHIIRRQNNIKYVKKRG